MNQPTLISIVKTPEYRRWENTLNDVAVAAIDARLRQLQFGNKGDWRAVGDGVSELRFIRAGPGWRDYFHETNQGALILLMWGGDKSSQKNDISKAKNILHALRMEKSLLKKRKLATRHDKTR